MELHLTICNLRKSQLLLEDIKETLDEIEFIQYLNELNKENMKYCSKKN
jgi:hypothetical protein